MITSIKYVAVEIEGFYSDSFETEGGLKLHKPLFSAGTKEKSYYAHQDNIRGVVVGLPSEAGDMLVNNHKSFPITNQDRFGKINTNQGEVDVEIGDMVYFHFLNVSPENRKVIKEENGKAVIAINYSDLYCKVVDGELQALNHYLIYEPYFGEDIEEFDLPSLTNPNASKIKGKRIKYGNLELILPSSGRKVAHGKVITASEGFEGSELSGVEPGDIVMVHKKREQEIEIEGRKVFVTWNTNAFAKFVDDQVIPLGRYVSIRPEEPDFGTALIVPDSVKDSKKKDTGVVSGVGMDCKEDLLIGDKVCFEQFMDFEGYDEYLVYEGQVMYRHEQV